jgi:hypothetical protein
MTRNAQNRLVTIRALAAWKSAKSEALRRRSDGVFLFLSLRMDLVTALWIALCAIVSVPKIAFAHSSMTGLADLAILTLPYLAIMVAPVFGYWAAAGSFPNGLLMAQPRFRLAIYGRWQRMSVIEAHGDPRFGPTGFMASLLVGLLLNVPVRLLEFAAAVPAMNAHAPAWGLTIFLSMTAEVCAMSFLYMACFVMALRNVPLFPRMLGFVWAMDMLAQLAIADNVASAGRLPLAVATALQDLLEGNIKKVIVSVIVWLPYLLLSERVNVTYRHRLQAR